MSCLLVSQYAVSLIERLHLFLAAALIRVAPRCHPFVQSLEVARARALVCAQDFVVIFVRIKLAHVGFAILGLQLLICNEPNRK